MTEHVDVNTQLLSPLEHNAGSGLYELLHDPESRKVFKSLIVSFRFLLGGGRFLVDALKLTIGIFPSDRSRISLLSGLNTRSNTRLL